MQNISSLYLKSSNDCTKAMALGGNVASFIKSINLATGNTISNTYFDFDSSLGIRNGVIPKRILDIPDFNLNALVHHSFEVN